jgi:hypothetical protein
MDSNIHSIRPAGALTALAAAVEGLAAQDLDGLADAVRAERILVLRRLVDRLEGHWLNELAAVDARGAAGAEEGAQAGSTAGWLRARLRMGAAAASSAVRTARALFAGPLGATGQALTHGDLSPGPRHRARGRHPGAGYPPHHGGRTGAGGGGPAAGPGPAAAGPGPPATGRRPETAASQAQRRHARRGLWLSPTLDGMVAIDGPLDPEAGQTLLAALEPLTRPSDADDARSGGQRRADALCELARRALEGGRLPLTGGVRPQLLVTVDLASLQGRSGLGGDTEAGPLDPEACRRLACDGALTRVLVTRHPIAEQPGPPPDPDRNGNKALEVSLRTAAALLPPVLGGAPSRWRSAAAAGSSAPPNAPPDRPRRRLWPPRLPPAPGLVPSPPPAPLAPRRPDRPGQPGLVVPGPPSGGPRGGLAARPRPDGPLTATPPHRPHRRHRPAA